MTLINKCKLLRKFVRSRQSDWDNYHSWGSSVKKCSWKKAGYELCFGRFPRGDVIELKKDNNMILAFADQDHQYSGIIGISDMEYTDKEITNAKFHIILELLRSVK
jgi:superfamily I DNA and RNA helicase